MNAHLYPSYLSAGLVIDDRALVGLLAGLPRFENA